MSAGYPWIGCQVRCHVEINPRYAAWLKTKQVPVIEGDIDNVQVQRALLPFVETRASSQVALPANRFRPWVISDSNWIPAQGASKG